MTEKIATYHFIILQLDSSSLHYLLNPLNISVCEWVQV